MKCETCGNRWAGPGVCPLHPVQVSKQMLREDAEEQRRRSRLAVNLQDSAATDPNRLTAEERYLRDPMFHALVDMLRGAILNADYTPTEIREAAMLAAIMVEMRRPARFILSVDPLPSGDVGGAFLRCSRCGRTDCWADVNGTPQCQNCGTYKREG